MKDEEAKLIRDLYSKMLDTLDEFEKEHPESNNHVLLHVFCCLLASIIQPNEKVHDIWEKDVHSAIRHYIKVLRDHENGI